MKIIRVLLLLLGFLLFIGGLLLFITNETASRGLILNSNVACIIAEKEQIKLEQIAKQYEAAKDTPEEIKLEVSVNYQRKNADDSSKTCAEGKSWARLRFGLFLSITFIGLFLLMIGFFVGRKKRTV